MAVRIEELEACYKNYHDRLYRAAYRITGNHEDAEDALQEAYLLAYQAFPAFRGQSAVSTWFYRITVNSAHKFIRQRKGFPVSAMARSAGISEAAFFERLADHEDVEDTVVTENIRETCLQMFLECMPRKQRIAFVLNVLMELPGNEVAEIMEITTGAVKTNVYRARQHMLNTMEGRCALIKAGNPCRCALWAAYTVKNGKDVLFSNSTPVRNSNLDYKTLALSELNFLEKVMALYNASPGGCTGDEFIERMRILIVEGDLHLLQPQKSKKPCDRSPLDDSKQ